jgi:hypothetical protein
MALRRNLELEIRRKTVEDAKRKAELEKLKRDSKTEMNTSKVNRDPRSRSKQFMKSQDLELIKDKKKTSPNGKSNKADIEKISNTAPEISSIKSTPSSTLARPEHFSNDRGTSKDDSHRTQESKEERLTTHRSDKEKSFSGNRKSSSPRSDRHRRDPREDTNRGRDDKKSDERSRNRRETSDNIRISREFEKNEQKQYNSKIENITDNKGNSNRNSNRRDHLTRPHRTYRAQRHSKSPSSEEEETELNIRPRRITPEPTRGQRRSRGSSTPDRLIPRKTAREEPAETAEIHLSETPDEGMLLV